MTLIRCPDCGRSVSDRALACPNCARPLAGARAGLAPYAGFEYRSERTLFGWPLVHAVYGPTGVGGLRPARGVFAFGNVAVGLVAFGGVAVGVVALGGIAVGLVSLAGIALGLVLGLGGIATGYWALGGVAIGVAVFGGATVSAHLLPGDAEWLRALRAALSG